MKDVVVKFSGQFLEPSFRYEADSLGVEMTDKQLNKAADEVARMVRRWFLVEGGAEIIEKAVKKVCK